MWICLSDSFLSCVASDQDPTVLMVRARRHGDIEAVFGDAYPVLTLGSRDYQFRAFIPRETVGAVIAARLVATSYKNFKGSVSDGTLHDAYLSIWHTMAALQPCEPYSSKERKGFTKHPKRAKL